MALPPIITNSPIGKLFGAEPAKSTDSAKGKDSETPQNTTQTQTRDVVEISDAAKAKLKEAEQLSETQARETAVETRDQLAEDESLTLGLQEPA